MFPESDFVFATERGGPFTPDAVNRLIKRIGERAGLSFRCTLTCCGMVARTKAGLAAARKRGIKLGGRNEQSDRNAAAAAERAEALRPVFSELQGLSANAFAAELNARGLPAPNRGQWFAVRVIRFRDRLAR